MSSRDFVSRRDFLSAGAASAVLIATGAARAAEDAPRDDIRAAMIGIGGRGSGVLKAIHKAAGVKVVALCDIDADHLKAAAKLVESDSPQLFSDYHKMLDEAKLDAVFVETPCFLHHEMVVAALKSGRHCYGEKPMALSVPHLNEIVKLAKSGKPVYQVGTQLPYADPWKSSIAAVQAGEIGKPIFIRAHRHNTGDLPHDHPWFFKRSTSGDTICEQAVHEFDIFNRIFQGIPERASGFGGQALLHEPKGRDIMDNYGLVLDYGKNKTVSYSHSWIAPRGVPADGRQEIVYGEKGAIDVEAGMLYPRDGAPRKLFDAEPKDSTQAAVDDFFRCIREGKKPVSDAEAGRNGALVALLGRKAIDEGRVVQMNELLTATS